MDIFTQGGSINGYNITNNKFSGSDYGVFIDGDNAVDITKNSFTSSYAGTILNATGDNTNVSNQNAYNSILVGIQTQGENDMHQSLDNCFSTFVGDMFLEGTVNEIMGDELVGAGNCFTKNGVPDITASTNTFKYFVHNQSTTSCRNPITNGNYLKVISMTDNSLNCGSSNPQPPSTKWNFCYPRKILTCAEIDLYLDQIQNEINLINSNVSFSFSSKQSMIKYLSACKLRLLKLKLMNCRPDVPFPAPEPLISTSSRFKDKADMIAMSIVKGDYNLGFSLLSNLNETNEIERDFKITQQINIQRIIQGSTYVLSIGDRNNLLAITGKNHPYSANARALYYLITGELILPNIIRYDQSTPRSAESISIEFNVYPNPISTNIFIEPNNEGEYNYKIYDLYGRIVDQHDHVIGRANISSDEWSSGLYFLKTKSELGIEIIKKLIK